MWLQCPPDPPLHEQCAWPTVARSSFFIFHFHHYKEGIFILTQQSIAASFLHVDLCCGWKCRANIIHIAFSEKLLTLLGIFLSSSLQALRNCIMRHLRKITHWFQPFQITLREEINATFFMILTTKGKSRHHFLTLYDIITQFKPRDLLADCVYASHV